MPKQRPGTRTGKQNQAFYKRQTKNRKKKISLASLSLDDGLPKGAIGFPEVAERLSIQKDREINLSDDNPRFVTTLKYSLKPEFDKWKLQETFQATHIATGSSATLHPEQILEHEFFFYLPSKKLLQIEGKNYE